MYHLAIPIVAIELSSKLFTLSICGTKSLYLLQQTATKLPTTGVGGLVVEAVQILFDGVVVVARGLRVAFLSTSI